MGVLSLFCGAVVREPARVRGLELDVATWSQVLKRPPEQCIFIANTAFQLAGVDKVKGFGIEPFCFEVVYFKGTVRRSPRPFESVNTAR